MDYTDQLLHMDAIIKILLKDGNSQRETWTLTGGGMRTYHYPFKVELTYNRCGSYDEEKSWSFYIAKSNHERGYFRLQTEEQRFGLIKNGYGLGGTDGSEISIWYQNYTGSFPSNECKSLRNRLKVAETILHDMSCGSCEEYFDTDEEKYTLRKIEGDFQHSHSHLKEIE
jgi:hypothetical protein